MDDFTSIRLHNILFVDKQTRAKNALVGQAVLK